ncbi:MAG: hypothetical protein K0R77_2132 [Chryseobacterium sp.]|jgi:hypothetical protein|uniref:AAA family ATPase n=1 Tax=Chryseobacterium sp. TaxID=1871047 RepID=UPI00260D89A9|nr:AAA family ATPase [Chryseobacterium sp.]MDF2552857.1 hypothetical protein [Chryseobacterium sp.]
MIYIRNIFRQDLRDGKQIAFPKEVSNQFFNFSYQDDDPDRNLVFIYKESNTESQFYIFNNTNITTRLYAAGTESRIDGELKRFLIDKLNAVIDDKVLFRKINDNKYEFEFIPSSLPKHDFIVSLIGNKNHEVLLLESAVSTSDGEDSTDPILSSISEEKKDSKFQPQNKIYFGPPGTGKSYAIKEFLKSNNVPASNYSRVTFHPDYDYASFVGGYRPFTDKDDGNIKYKFVSQVFTDLYVKSWENFNNENYFLVIEEINRGNCAEIFGDIFQLLDRNPEYNIEPSSELRNYLIEKEKEINKNKKEGTEDIKLLFDGKLQMPDNLSVLASMNTSDQSLYPMDSAFKRRWDWEYIPINTKCQNSNFTIEIHSNHQYSWLEFLEKVNISIYSVTKSEDKQLGNWFINAEKTKKIIEKDIFINKVLFYLWNDIFKDEVYHQDNIFVKKREDGSKDKDISFNDFYNKDEQNNLLIHLFERVLKISKVQNEPERNVDNQETGNTEIESEIASQELDSN